MVEFDPKGTLVAQSLNRSIRQEHNRLKPAWKAAGLRAAHEAARNKALLLRVSLRYLSDERK